ncbi:hypothetical protein I3760_01G238300 [Carya illinoinensis]|nr:hypothetical protein I3760_01G238300 [Carya illinoinensis]
MIIMRSPVLCFDQVQLYDNENCYRYPPLGTCCGIADVAYATSADILLKKKKKNINRLCRGKPPIFFFLILCDTSHGRFITHRTHFSLSSNLVSDGVQQLRGPPYLALNRSSSFSAESTCEQTYGFLPCSTTVLGNIFLIVIYDYLMFLNRSSPPPIVGSLLLPILRPKTFEEAESFSPLSSLCFQTPSQSDL